MFKNPDSLNDEVSQAMQPPLAAADAADTLDRVFSDLSGREPGRRRRARRQAGRDAHTLGPARVSRARPERFLSLTLAALRRHVVAAQGYATRYRVARPDDVAESIRRLSAVQLDSISTVDRSHRLTLLARVGRYPPGRCRSS